MNKFFKKITPILVLISFLCFIPTPIHAENNFSSTLKSKDKTNDYPIIMVHGLFGWGNDELGINYWGGKSSLKEILEDKGYTVYTPTIGPVSSNWDRACELYAYIKGGTVDYGEYHSKKYGHNRYGTTYPGIYPELGTNTTNDIKKIHLVGHSMGGETIRVLAQLLEQGNENEINSTGEDTSPLFTGNHHWIESITTIATPHNGSQEAKKQISLEPFVHQYIAALAAKYGANPDTAKLDFKLDQWGLKREPNESYEDYYKRISQSNIWNETKDLSIWDLSPEGAKELNSWVSAQSDIYYFSIACSDTHKNLSTGYQVPNINMISLLKKSSLFLGSYTCNNPDEVPIDNSWWENDGVVSVSSAIGPTVGSTDKIINFDGIPQKGVWNYLGLINNIDHIEVVGQSEPMYKHYLQNKFIDLAKTLTTLPN